MPSDGNDAVVRNRSNIDRVDSPLLKYTDDFMLTSRFGYGEHSLLALAQHHFVAAHIAFSNWNEVEVD